MIIYPLPTIKYRIIVTHDVYIKYNSYLPNLIYYNKMLSNTKFIWPFISTIEYFLYI